MQLTLTDVGHRFGDAPWLFRALSYKLVPGGVYGLVGPSGSGKSTLLSLIAGWEQPTVGHIERDGINKVAWVFQNPHGVAERSALDHVMLPCLARGSTMSQAEIEARALLATFSLSGVAAQPFSSLSGGEAQRLMLARGVATHPSLLLVDEPTAQLDLNTRICINEAIGQLANADTIVVVATHDEATRDACSHIIDLRDYQELSDADNASNEAAGGHNEA